MNLSLNCFSPSRSISSLSSSSWGKNLTVCCQTTPPVSYWMWVRVKYSETQWSAAKTKSFLLLPFKVKESGGTTSSKWLKRLVFDLTNLSVSTETQIDRLDVLHVTSVLSYRCKTLTSWVVGKYFSPLEEGLGCHYSQTASLWRPPPLGRAFSGLSKSRFNISNAFCNQNRCYKSKPTAAEPTRVTQ